MHWEKILVTCHKERNSLHHIKEFFKNRRKDHNSGEKWIKDMNRQFMYMARAYVKMSKFTQKRRNAN